MAHFLVTLLAVVGIGSLEKVSLNKGIQTLKQVLLVAYVNVESCERLLSGVPAPANGSSKYTTHYLSSPVGTTSADLLVSKCSSKNLREHRTVAKGLETLIEIVHQAVEEFKSIVLLTQVDSISPQSATVTSVISTHTQVSGRDGYLNSLQKPCGVWNCSLPSRRWEKMDWSCMSTFF